MRGWVARLLAERTGYGGRGRWAFRHRCASCGHLVLVGLDSHVAAFEVAADFEELDPYAETVARLDGRGTYALRRVGQHLELTARDRWQIAGEPAGTKADAIGGYVVVAEHGCEKW